MDEEECAIQASRHLKLMAELKLRGVMTALVTPFDSRGEIDFEALRRHVERQIEGGVSALVPCGTTGESPTLPADEHVDVVAKVVDYAAGRVPVIAGAGANSTREACHLTRMAAEVGAQGTLQVSPYYNKPTQEGLYAHYCEIADASNLPVVVYNIPGRTSVRIEAVTLARLAAHPNIRAVKEATGDLNFASLVRQLAPDLALLSGDDSLTVPLMSVGAAGVVSVASNLVPRRMVELVDAMASGDLAGARELHGRLFPLFRSLFLETNPIPVKTAMHLLDYCEPGARLPLQEASEDTRAALQSVLSDLGLLG